MASRRIIVTSFALVLYVAFGATAYSAPVNQPATPVPLPLTVTPSTVQPGQTIHVSVAGLAGLPIAGKTGCLGILGPGRNVELNVSPQFRPQIGTMAIAVNGTGQADAPVPTDLVGGSYRVIFGGCSPHGNIAPLFTAAEATITVIGPTPVATPVPKLPATGGTPPIAAALVVAMGLAFAAVGLALRKTDRIH